MVDFWREGIAVLESLIGQEGVREISRQKSQEIAQKNRNIYEDLNQQITSPSSYLILGDLIPRYPENATSWQEDTKHYFGQGITPFINDIEDDPHSRYDLASLHHCISDLGIDPTDPVTSDAYKIEHLILLGVGDGTAAQQLINFFKPKMLTVAVCDWREWSSSFFHMNWLDIWNRYCTSDDHYIAAMCCDTSNAILNHLFHTNPLGLDHAYVYVSPVSSEKTQKVKKLMDDGITDRLIGYSGFVMDEYNMIWNSWKSLKTNPRIFHRPRGHDPKGDYLVVGSGPSLDASLPWIYENQDRLTIISCASNYGPLRSHGIDVDYLCLLERGDFMVEQYRKVVEMYGSGKTKLLASVTTPCELLDLFRESMVYFRPSLTPCSIFSDNDSQVLSGEGPQTVNTGVAFALTQSPERIILCGVDLGTANLEKVRTSDAIGDSPRDFDKKVPGNFQEYVYTNDLLLDGVRVLEFVPETYSDSIKLINASNGVRLKGWSSQQLSDLNLAPLSQTQSEDWWNRQPYYSSEKFEASFIAAQPRRMVAKTLNGLRSEVSQANLSNWLSVRKQCAELVALPGKSRYEQFTPRIVRGHVYRFLISIHRELIVLARFGPDLQEKFLASSLRLFSKRIDELEQEILDLIDQLESLEP